jgi:rubrerythrin/ferredoxin
LANITFSSPVMPKDVTVYAVAGDRGTILAVAKAHKIPIPFDCQDGECGSCLIEVENLNDKTKYGVALTEKEKEMLKQLGKITKKEIEDAEVNDLPPRYRLACQCFVRNEDIIVKFEGDQTLPSSGPHVTHAAARFKGGLEIASVDEFLSYAVKVEEDAALHFDALAKAVESSDGAEIAKLFSQLAALSREHLAEAKGQAKSLDASKTVPPDYAWPSQSSPESAHWSGDPALMRLGALKAALQGEKRGFEFYCAVVATSKSPDVVALAKQFVKEEAEHVKILEASVTHEEWATRSAKAH